MNMSQEKRKAKVWLTLIRRTIETLKHTNFKEHLSRHWLAVCAVIGICAVATCFYFARSPATDYVPLILVFLSAIAAIRGKSWDESRQGLSRVTLIGFILFALALLGLVGGIRNTQINHAKLAEVETIRNIGYRQIMEGISMVIFPITSSWREPPTNDTDILDKAQDSTTIDALAKTRIAPFANRAKDFMAMVDDPRFFLISAHGTRVTTRCGAPHQGFRSLYELFDFCVSSGEDKIREAEQTFFGNLDPKTIQLLHDILDNEFYKLQYSNLSQHEALFYQGLRDEVGEDLATADQTWLALIEVSRALLPEADDDDISNLQDGPSPWLYLGTYYFGEDSDSTAYKMFIGKVGEFVKHVGVVMNDQSLIETFK